MTGFYFKFEPEVLTYMRRCSECGKEMPKGSEALVSRKHGKVKKIVCSEECRVNFDDAIWQHYAAERNRRIG